MSNALGLIGYAAEDSEEESEEHSPEEDASPAEDGEQAAGGADSSAVRVQQDEVQEQPETVGGALSLDVVDEISNQAPGAQISAQATPSALHCDRQYLQQPELHCMTATPSHQGSGSTCVVTGGSFASSVPVVYSRAAQGAGVDALAGGAGTAQASPLPQKRQFSDTGAVPGTPDSRVPSSSGAAGKCPPALQERVKTILEVQAKKNRSMVDELKSKRAYRNPHFMEKIVDSFGISQYGTCFSKDVLDPDGLPPEDFLSSIQARLERRKSEKRAAREAAASAKSKVVRAHPASAPASVPSIASLSTSKPDVSRIKRSKWGDTRQ